MAFSFALFEPSQTIMPKLPKSDNLEPVNRHFRDYPEPDMPRTCQNRRD